jgi:hypothetical protein
MSSSNKIIPTWNAYQDMYENTMIINTKYGANGQVNIIEPDTPAQIIEMHERISLKNKATSYCDALGGNWEQNVLSQVFFSAENIQIIQNALRAGVYELSGKKFVICPQNIESLKIVMRSTFLQYAIFDEKNIRGQVERLNKLVLDYCIPSVYGEAVAYIKYAKDQSTLVVPMDLPIPTDRNYKQLEFKPFF